MEELLRYARSYYIRRSLICLGFDDIIKFKLKDGIGYAILLFWLLLLKIEKVIRYMLKKRRIF